MYIYIYRERERFIDICNTYSDLPFSHGVIVDQIYI